ncbi:MAG TPA: hypothetical protein VF791_21915 [Pyrinomonadaceae bacterium]
MRNSLALMLLAGACYLIFSQEARADVNTITEVSYYEPTNSILAWAEVIPDYDTLAYYCFDDWGEVRKNDVVINSFWGGSCEGESYYEGFFPYDPAADYSIEVYPQLIVKHWIPSPGDGYDDYYNYNEWTYGDSVYFPYYFSFTGPGPETAISYNTIILGAVYSIFTEGGTAGQPHHLKLVSDTFPLTDCGSVRRWLKFRVVDANGRRAGNVRVEETFETTSQPPTGIQCLYNSCQSNNYCPPGCQGMDLDGTFTDQLWVGCPSAGGDCGFSPSPVVSRWWWCPARFGRVSLTANTYEIRHNQVLVNGRSTAYPSGTEFR